MTKSIFSLLVTLCVAVFSACGGGGDIQIALPATAADVSKAFDAAPRILQTYGYEMETTGRSSNPDTVMERSGDLNSGRLVITYKGKVIYDEVRGWGIYDAHGFAADGTYLILLIEHDAGDYQGKAVLFVNGERVALPAVLQASGTIGEVRDYGDGRLIFQLTSGSIRSGTIFTSFSLYNPKTGEFVYYNK